MTIVQQMPITSDSRQTTPTWASALREAGVVMTAAIFILTICFASAFRWIHPEFSPFMGREASTMLADGAEFVPISLTEYSTFERSLRIERFNDDEAIIALPIQFTAEDYPFIKVNATGLSRYEKIKLLWRTVESPTVVNAVELQLRKDNLSQIALPLLHQEYKGEIADIGLLIFKAPGAVDSNKSNIAVHRVEFRPFSMSFMFEQVVADLTHTLPWRHSSHNFFTRSHANPIVRGNLALNLVAITAILLIAAVSLLRRRCRQDKHADSGDFLNSFYSKVFAILIIGHVLVFIDISTMAVARSLDAWERYNGLNINERRLRSPLLCSRFEDCGGSAIGNSSAYLT